MSTANNSTQRPRRRRTAFDEPSLTGPQGDLAAGSAIPHDTPEPVLLDLRRRYRNPDDSARRQLPDWYVAAITTRIDRLLAAIEAEAHDALSWRLSA